MRYRLIKPQWGKDLIEGPNIIEGEYNEEFVVNRNRLGYNVYYFPNSNSKPIKGKFLSGKEIDVYQWVFVDMDLKDGIYADKGAFLEKLAAFPVQPTRIVDSGNGMHAYWKVDGLNRESFVESQFRLINHFDTDASVWTLLQLMRLPGSMNTKDRENFKLAELLVSNTDVRYTPEELWQHLPDMSETQATKLRTHLNKLDGITETIDLDAYDTDDLPECFDKLLETDRYVRQLWNAPKGERSDADWKLAHLLFEKDYGKYNEALPVFMNTQKALSKGNYRRQYALDTVAKVWQKEEDFAVLPVAQVMHTERKDQGKRVLGPPYFDATASKWRKGEVIGMIAGPGVGKTTATLDIIKGVFENNPDSDDVAIIFSLEMQDWEIIDRWRKLVGEDSPFNHRLYVVSNEDENGLERHINLQKMFWYTQGIKRTSGKNVAVIAIDHIGVVDNSIDISKKPTFGVMGEDMGFGTTRSISLELMCAKMKTLAKQLNVLLIVQSQTTKGRAKDGDTELGADAAYGTAKFEWYVDYILTFWQPLRRVEGKTDLRVLGWQYCKIRNKSPDDKIQVYNKKVLKVDLRTGRLAPLSGSEMIDFEDLEKEATKLREDADKNKSSEYTNSDGFAKLKAILAIKNAQGE